MTKKSFLLVSILTIFLIVGLFRFYIQCPLIYWTFKGVKIHEIQGKIRNFPGDFLYYYLAAKGAGQGYNPYDLKSNESLAKKLGFPHPKVFSVVEYLYPPTFTLMMLSFTILPVEKAAYLWNILNIGFFIAGLIIISQSIPTNTFKENLDKNGPSTKKFNSKEFLYFLLALTLALNFFPLYNTFAQGQSNILLFFILSIMLWGLLYNKKMLAGSMLALGVAIKITPVLFGLFLLWKRDYKTIIFASLTGLFLILVTIITFQWEALVIYFSKVIPFMAAEHHQGAYNVSLSGFLSRSFISSSYNQAIFEAPLFAKWGSTLGTLLILLLSYWLTRKKMSQTPKTEFISEFSLMICTLHLISTHSWRHHLVLLLIPFIFIGILLLRSSLKKNWLFLIFYLLAFILTAFEFPALQDQYKTGWKVLLMSPQFLGLTILWLLLVFIKIPYFKTSGFINYESSFNSSRSI